MSVPDNSTDTSLSNSNGATGSGTSSPRGDNRAVRIATTLGLLVIIAAVASIIVFLPENTAQRQHLTHTIGR
ncbi:MAG: hypothetical protein AAFN70_17645, partial [Planctomycetota bacterium]